MVYGTIILKIKILNYKDKIKVQNFNKKKQNVFANRISRLAFPLFISNRFIGFRI